MFFLLLEFEIAVQKARFTDAGCGLNGPEPRLVQVIPYSTVGMAGPSDHALWLRSERLSGGGYLLPFIDLIVDH